VKVVLRIIDYDAEESTDVVLEGGAPMPAVDDVITFEVRPGEWISKYVSEKHAIRYSPDEVVFEVGVTALDDDEEA
jgi:hypothetical protein